MGVRADFRMPALMVLALGCALVPLWSTTTPPLLDYHNHLARQYIVANIGGSEILAAFYRTSWHATPYLAFDGIVQALATLMPVDVAGKVFLSLMLLLLAAAPMALNLALFGRVTPVALLGLLFVHNNTVTLGFVNYVFGIGFALCGVALWIRLRRAALWTRLLLAPLVCTLVFFSHLLGFVVYLLVIGSYELGRYLAGIARVDGRRRFMLDRDQGWNLLSLLLQSAIPLLIFAAFGPSTESVAKNTYGGIARKFQLLANMFGYLMPPYLWTLDQTMKLVLPVLLVALLVMRRLRMAPGMVWPLAAVLLMFFVMPMELFSGWGADHRLLPVLGFLLVGALAPTDVVRPRPLRWAFAAVGLLAVVRTAAVTVDWRKANDEYADYLRAFDAVHDGGRMYYAFGHAGGQHVSTRPVYHLPTLVLARREAYVPFLFASSSGGFTLQYRSEVEPLQRLSKGPVLTHGASPDWPAIVDQFDHFLLVDERHFREPPPAGLALVYEGGSVRMYQRRLVRRGE